MGKETNSEAKRHNTINFTMASLNIRVNTLNVYLDNFKKEKGSKAACLAEELRWFISIIRQDMNSIDLCIKEDRLQRAKERLKLEKQRAKKRKKQRKVQHLRKNFKLVSIAKR